MTRVEEGVLIFVHRRQTETGISPSLREIAKGIGYSPKSHAAVHTLIKRLEAEGALRTKPGRHRSIEVIRVPNRCLTAAEVAWCHDHAAEVRREMAKTAG